MKAFQNSLIKINEVEGQTSSDATFRKFIRTLFKDSSIYGLGVVTNRFIGLFLLPLYTRLFTPAEYGLLDLLTTTGAILLIVSELQILSGVARGYYESKTQGRTRDLVGTAITLYTFSAALCTGCGLVAFYVWGDRFGASLGWKHVLPVMLGLLPSQLFSLLQIILRYEGQPRQFIFFSAIEVLTSAVLSVVAVIFLGWGVAGVLWGTFASKLIWGVVLLYLRRGYFAWHYDKRLSREILGYGLPIVPAVLTKWGQNYANRYVLVLALSLTDVGLFSLAVRISAVIAMVNTAFRQAWDPYAIQMFGEKNSEPVFARMLRFYLACMLAACALMAVLGTPLVRVISGKEYVGAGPLVGFLAFGLLWNSATNMLGAGNGWARRTYWNGLGFAAGAALNLSLLFWAAPRWGLLAAGVTYLVGTLVAAWVVFATAQRSHYIPYKVTDLLLATIGSIVFSCSVYYMDALPALYNFSEFTLLALRLLVVSGIVVAVFIFASVRGFGLKNFTDPR